MNKDMKYTRKEVHDIRKSLNDAYCKIEKVFDSIETQEHYNTFYNMCQNLLKICTFWDEELCPSRPYFLHKKQVKLYDMFYYTAKDVVDKMNFLIDLYTDAAAEQAEYEKRYEETAERLKMEREIINNINASNNKEFSENHKVVGFKAYQVKKKRKYTKKNNE